MAKKELTEEEHDKIARKMLEYKMECYKCKDGIVCWNDDTKTQVTLSCSACGFVYHQFAVRPSKRNEHCWTTDDQLMRMMIYNMKKQNMAFGAPSERGYEVSDEEVRDGRLSILIHGDGSVD